LAAPSARVRQKGYTSAHKIEQDRIIAEVMAERVEPAGSRKRGAVVSS
jgi:hypothetical protein